jgi:peptidylprolyl isomerase
MIAVCASLAVAGCGESDSATGSASSEGKEVLGPKPKIPTGPHTNKLIVKDLKKGTGPVVHRGDSVEVHYVGGNYETGDEFESAWHPNHPLGLLLTPAGVLPGWVHGMPGMRVGGRRELIFPATKGHAPLEMQPGETIVYVVDLVGIE